MATRDDFTTHDRFTILHRDAFTCLFCGDRPGNAQLEVDHLLPWSKRGSHDPRNLATSCKRCNNGKSDRIYIPPSLCHDPKPDRAGLSTWKRWGDWSIQFDHESMIVALLGDREYLHFWFDITSIHDPCWDGSRPSDGWYGYAADRFWEADNVAHHFGTDEERARAAEISAAARFAIYGHDKPWLSSRDLVKEFDERGRAIRHEEDSLVTRMLSRETWAKADADREAFVELWDFAGAIVRPPERATR